MVIPFASAENVAAAAADRFIETASGPGPVRIALSGGRTPLLMYRMLRDRHVDWNNVEIFWSDERMVPPDHPESNEGQARRELLDHVAIGEDQIHGIYTSGDPRADCLRYEERIRAFDGVFDLLYLGMGTDGHTASLFPGDPASKETSRWVVPSISPDGVRKRTTFTVPLIARARSVAVLVAGKDKAEAWRKVVKGQELPIGDVLRAVSEAEVLLWVG